MTRYFLNAINIGLGARIVKSPTNASASGGKVPFLFMAFISLILSGSYIVCTLK